MKLATHRISWDLFSTLARGGGGPTAIEQLRAARRSKNLALIRALVHLASVAGHPEASLARVAYRALSLIQQQAPRAVETMLDYPSVGVWAVRTTLALLNGESARARPSRLATIAASAAVRGRAVISIELPPVEPGRRTIALPSLGTIRLPGSARAPALLTSRADGAALSVGDDLMPIPSDPHRDSWPWYGIRRISTEFQGLKMEVLLDPSCCYSLPEPITVCLPETIRRDAYAWAARLGEGWELLVRGHPDVAAEVAATTKVLVPLSPSLTGQISATFRDAFGCMAMSLPADAQVTALTLAHEIQHNKLAALMDLFPLVTDTSDTYFYAPWRDDPRPLHGLLHGFYAYVGVTNFWRRQYDYEDRPDEKFHAQIEFARWRAGVRQVASVLLGTGKLTPTGERFIAITNALLDEWCQARIPEEAAARAEWIAGQHRQHWNQANGQSGRP